MEQTKKPWIWIRKHAFHQYAFRNLKAQTTQLGISSFVFKYLIFQQIHVNYVV